MTFFCTAIATIYSVLTATTALKQASIDLRPWIVITKTLISGELDHLETRSEIVNIGKTPAYLDIESHAYRNGNEVIQIHDQQSEYQKVIMPGQKIYYNGFVMKGEWYQKLLKGDFKEEVIQSTIVKYGSSSDEIGKYWTYVKLRFDVNDVSDAIKGGSEFGAWDIVEADFK